MAKKQEKKTTEKTEGSSHKFGWFALFTVLSIVGVAVWFVINADDI